MQSPAVIQFVLLIALVLTLGIVTGVTVRELDRRQAHSH